MANTASTARGKTPTDSKIATGLPPTAAASPTEKARYSTVRYHAQDDHFVGFYRTWTKAVNFLAGEQWRQIWDGINMTWQARTDLPPWAQQPVTNITYRTYRAAQAKLTKQKPELEVVPASGSSEDQESAELSDSLLVDLWRRLNCARKLPTVIGWMLISGTGWVRVAWNPEAGERRPRTIPIDRHREALATFDSLATAMGAEQPAPDVDSVVDSIEVAADENGDPYTTTDDDGKPTIDFEREPDIEPIGDITWEAESPFAVRLNPDATSLDDITEMYVGKLYPKPTIAKRYGVKEEDLTPVGDNADNRAVYEDLMSATAAGYPRSWTDMDSPWGVSQEMAIGDRALVIEYYAKPSDKFPQGRHWISCGDLQLWPRDSVEDGAELEAEHFPNNEAPLPGGFWPPLVPFADTPIPGQPTAVPLIPQIVPLNEALNRLDAGITEKHAVDSMGGIWIISPDDLETFHPTSEPGQVQVSVAMGRKGAAYAPFQATLKELPAAVYNERNVITNKVQLVSSLNALDRSEKASGTSGRALLVDQETSDSEFMPTLFSVEWALEECGRRQLILAQQHYREERVISIRQQDGRYLFRSFTNADLRSGHDVRVGVGSSFPWSKAAQWDTKLNILQTFQGLVVDPKTGKVDREMLARFLDSGTPGLGVFESDEDPDLVEVQREHAMFEDYAPRLPNGAKQVPQVAFWQNHLVHLQQHQDFMKKSFERFLRWTPEAQAAFLGHIKLTIATIQEAANAMAGGGGPTQPETMGGAGQPGGAAPSPGPGAPPTLTLVPGSQGNGPGTGSSQMTPQLTPTDFNSAATAAAG